MYYLKIICAFIFLVFMVSCNTEPRKPQIPDNIFTYPESKIWAHRTNEIEVAKGKKGLFVGLEIDLIYSINTNTLYVAHDPPDTLENKTFDNWLAALSNHSDNHYWLDIKNLDLENAYFVGTKVYELADKYDIVNNIIIESTFKEALKIIKKTNLHVLYWVENITWIEDKDTNRWKNRLTQAIKELEPFALSCSFTMYPLLSDSFPNNNIHYWHNTPSNYTSEDVELTKKICRTPNVKVVLVDYDYPINY